MIVAACVGDDLPVGPAGDADAAGGLDAAGSDGSRADASKDDGAVPAACDRAMPFGALEPVRTDPELSEAWFTPSSDERTGYAITGELVDGGLGDFFVYELSRSSTSEPWTSVSAVRSPVNLPGYGAARTAITGDGKELYLSIAPLGSGAIEVYVARRDSTTLPFSTPERSNLNIDGQATFLTWVRGDGLVAYYAAAKAGQDVTGLDLYRVERGSVSSAFGAPTPLPFNSSVIDANPVVTDDELELYFVSNLSGSNLVYRSRRTTRADGFGPPVVVDELNAAHVVSPVALSGDGCVMYVITVQGKTADGTEVFDLWQTRRPK